MIGLSLKRENRFFKAHIKTNQKREDLQIHYSIITRFSSSTHFFHNTNCCFLHLCYNWVLVHFFETLEKCIQLRRKFVATWPWEKSTSTNFAKKKETARIFMRGYVEMKETKCALKNKHFPFQFNRSFSVSFLFDLIPISFFISCFLNFLSLILLNIFFCSLHDFLKKTMQGL